jgi:hypothetical protein
MRERHEWESGVLGQFCDRLINISVIQTQPRSLIVIGYVVDKVYESSLAGCGRIKRLDCIVDQEAGIAFVIQAF